MVIDRRQFVQALVGLLASFSVYGLNTNRQWTGAEAVIRQRSCKIVGIGGAGCNLAIDLSTDAAFDASDLTTEFIAIDLGKNSLRGVNTANRTSPDRQASQVIKTVVLSEFTKSRLHHNHVEVLRMREALRPMLVDAQMVILLAGTAGNTGSSVTPIMARLAREMGAMTMVAVIKPHEGEGEIRVHRSAAAVQTLQREANSVECFSAQALMEEVSGDINQNDFYENQDQQIFAYIHDLIQRATKS